MLTKAAVSFPVLLQIGPGSVTSSISLLSEREGALTMCQQGAQRNKEYKAMPIRVLVQFKKYVQTAYLSELV